MTPPSLPVSASGRTALDVARALAEDAGRLMRESVGSPRELAMKGRGNVLTETDLACERHIIAGLAREFPDHAVLSEETATETPLDGFVWVVDPLDGTKNFVSGIPFYCCNIALCKDGEPLVAVTHDPNHNETFWAQRGGGAFLNDEPVRASRTATVLESVVGLDIGYDNDRGRSLLQMALDLFPGMQSLRIPGSAALGIAYVACGRYDVFVHRFLYPWDLAAGILLVREAGGVISEFDGGPIGVTSRTILAAGPDVHADFLSWQRGRAVEA